MGDEVMKKVSPIIQCSMDGRMHSLDKLLTQISSEQNGSLALPAAAGE